jgi:hypothetical protein
MSTLTDRLVPCPPPTSLRQGTRHLHTTDPLHRAAHRLSAAGVHPQWLAHTAPHGVPQPPLRPLTPAAERLVCLVASRVRGGVVDARRVSGLSPFQKGASVSIDLRIFYNYASTLSHIDDHISGLCKRVKSERENSTQQEQQQGQRETGAASHLLGGAR